MVTRVGVIINYCRGILVVWKVDYLIIKIYVMFNHTKYTLIILALCTFFLDIAHVCRWELLISITCFDTLLTTGSKIAI